MNYTYKIIIRDSKFIIEEFLIEQLISRYSLNTIIRIKNNPNNMCFKKESSLRALKWLKENHPEYLI